MKKLYKIFYEFSVCFTEVIPNKAPKSGSQPKGKTTLDDCKQLCIVDLACK